VISISKSVLMILTLEVKREKCWVRFVHDLLKLSCACRIYLARTSQWMFSFFGVTTDTL